MIKNLIRTTLAVVLGLFITQPTDACTGIIITKGASQDGSVMITYAADSHQLYGELYFTPAGIHKPGTLIDIHEWDTGKFLGRIPQIGRTYQTVGNMNEYQLMITESTFGGRSELYDPQGIMDYGSLIYIALQRAKTAREAIDVIVDLMDEHGYASSGESFSIADKNEAWMMEIIGKGSKIVNGENVYKGAVWVATRIPDGYIAAHANQARITNIDFADRENWLYSKDVISFAREMGYFEGEDKDFSFADAYAPLDFGAMRYCEARVWSAYNILGKGMIGDRTAESYLDYAMGYNAENRLPLYFKPQEKLSLREVANAMRDHYEGSPMDMTVDAGAGGHKTPYRWRPMSYEVDGQKYLNERAIATQQTGFWTLCQARNWLPDVIGGINWFGVDDAGTSSLTPIYASTTEIPECLEVGNGSIIEYSPTSLFWVTNRVANFAYMLYDRVAPEIINAIDAHENRALTEIEIADSFALSILGDYTDGDTSRKTLKKEKKVREYLTEFSVNYTQNLFEKWQELDTYLLVKYMDGNVKVQNPDGTFKNNGNNDRIPASPLFPGYSEAWKKAAVQSNGEILKMR